MELEELLLLLVVELPLLELLLELLVVVVVPNKMSHDGNIESPISNIAATISFFII